MPGDSGGNDGAGVLRKVEVALKNSGYSTTEVLIDQSQGRGACHGDSGGPAFLIQGGQAYLFGVTSRELVKPGSQATCSSDVVYTNILAELSFLNSAASTLEGQSMLSQNYLTVGQIKIESTSAGRQLDAPVNFPMPSPSASSGNDPIAEITAIINIGKQIWAVIAANKPVVNVQTNLANAIPAGITDWTVLAGWQVPQAREYRVTYKNLYGITVVDFTFRILYTPGGSLNGHGEYLTNATIVPAQLSVAWGYTFNAQSTVAGVMNAGTPKDPIAALQLQLHWSVDTVMSHKEDTDDFYVKGDGTFQALGSSGS